LGLENWTHGQLWVEPRNALWVRQCSGAGTNLKVGEHRSGAKCPKKIGRALHFFVSKSTIGRFCGERFRDGQYSSVSFLFAVLLLTVRPRAQPFVKVGARAHVPYGVGVTAPVQINDEMDFAVSLRNCVSGVSRRVARFGEISPTGLVSKVPLAVKHRSVSDSGNRHPIHTLRVPAVAMIG